MPRKSTSVVDVKVNLDLSKVSPAVIDDLVEWAARLIAQSLVDGASADRAAPKNKRHGDT